jgi:fructokinase
MDTRGIQRDPALPTGTATVHRQGRQHRFEIGSDQAWDRIDATEAAQAVRSARPAIVYFGTLAQRSAASRAAIRAALEATPATRFLDLNLRDGPDNRSLAAESLAYAKLVKVNDEELDRLLAWFAPGAGATPLAQHDAVRALMRSFDLERLVVTRGAAGWSCFSAGEAGVLEGRSRPARVRDTVGAGDAFASLLLLGEARRWPLSLTLQRAGEFAAAVCTIQGAFDASAGIYDAARASWQG